MELIITKGLPASGKSTWAKKMVTDNPGKYKRINKDDMRSMLDNSKWSKHNERFVLQARNYLIEKALQEGFSVIVDDTNLHPKHETDLRDIAKAYAATFKIQDFTDISLEECIARDLHRYGSVGEAVIRDMYERYLQKPVPVVEYDPDLRDCYIFDIDGTLAIKGDRSPYAWDKVGEDTPNLNVVETIKRLRYNSHNPNVLILFSGRDAVCQSITLEWLAKHNIPFDDLVMRPEGDMRKDTIIKQEMYESTVKGKFNVIGIFDDRNQVVQMWRSLGLPCFQVADGNF